MQSRMRGPGELAFKRRLNFDLILEQDGQNSDVFI